MEPNPIDIIERADRIKWAAKVREFLDLRQNMRDSSGGRGVTRHNRVGPGRLKRRKYPKVKVRRAA